MTNDTSITFEYRAAWLPSILGGILFSAGAIFMAQQAVTNDQGLIINGVIELGTVGATRFNWAVCGILAIMGFFSLFQVFLRLATQRQVRLTRTEVVAPKHFMSLQYQELPLKDIEACELIESDDDKVLMLHSRVGRSMKIPESYLGKSEFLQLQQALVEQIGGKGRIETNFS